MTSYNVENGEVSREKEKEMVQCDVCVCVCVLGGQYNGDGFAVTSPAHTTDDVVLFVQSEEALPRVLSFHPDVNRCQNMRSIETISHLFAEPTLDSTSSQCRGDPSWDTN